MATFIWKAKTRIGEVRSGEMEADTKDVVELRLKNQQLQVVRIRKKAADIVILMPGQTGVESRDLMIFTRQFATMIDAGLPMVQCLEILGGQTDNPIFKKILLDVKHQVEQGTTLNAALKKHPKIFDKFFCGLIEAGEAGGILDIILERLADYIEKASKLNKEIKAAMTYPVLVLGISAIVVGVLLVFVIPIFEKVFESSGTELPGPTKLVIAASEFAQNNAFLIIVGFFGAIFAFKKFYGSKVGRLLVDQFLLEAPGIGSLIQKIAVSKFTRTMGTMLSSGVPILEALDIVAVVAGNQVIENGLKRVQEEISNGKSMSSPLAEMKAFPPMVVQMITVGESTGALDRMLYKIADFYDEEVDSAVGTMMGVIEPAIMGFLAIILGGIIIAMYLPVFTMAGSA